MLTQEKNEKKREEIRCDILKETYLIYGTIESTNEYFGKG
jgi:hypothetical protein